MSISGPSRRALTAAFGVSIAVVTFAGPASAAPYSSQPTISVSDQTPEAGSRLRVCGTDFHARTKVSITLDEGRRLARVRTSRSGAFCKTVRVPSRASGPHTIVAKDRRGATASVLINIVGCRDRHDGDDNRHEGRGNRGRGNEGCGNDHDGRGDGNSDRDVRAIRAHGVSASSAIPVRAAGVSTSAGASGLAVAGAGLVATSALLGGGVLLLTGRRRKVRF